MLFNHSSRLPPPSAAASASTPPAMGGGGGSVAPGDLPPFTDCDGCGATPQLLLDLVDGRQLKCCQACAAHYEKNGVAPEVGTAERRQQMALDRHRMLMQRNGRAGTGAPPPMAGGGMQAPPQQQQPPPLMGEVNFCDGCGSVPQLLLDLVDGRQLKCCQNCASVFERNGVAPDVGTPERRAQMAAQQQQQNGGPRGDERAAERAAEEARLRQMLMEEQRRQQAMLEEQQRRFMEEQRRFMDEQQRAHMIIEEQRRQLMQQQQQLEQAQRMARQNTPPSGAMRGGSAASAMPTPPSGSRGPPRKPPLKTRPKSSRDVTAGMAPRKATAGAGAAAGRRARPQSTTIAEDPPRAYALPASAAGSGGSTTKVRASRRVTNAAATIAVRESYQIPPMTATERVVEKLARFKALAKRTARGTKKKKENSSSSSSSNSKGGGGGGGGSGSAKKKEEVYARPDEDDNDDVGAADDELVAVLAELADLDGDNKESVREEAVSAIDEVFAHEVEQAEAERDRLLAAASGDSAKRDRVQQAFKQRVRSAQVERDARISVLADDDDLADDNNADDDDAEQAAPAPRSKAPARGAPERNAYQQPKARTGAQVSSGGTKVGVSDALDEFLSSASSSGRKKTAAAAATAKPSRNEEAEAALEELGELYEDWGL